MKNLHIALIFFAIGLGLAILSMVLGPLGWVTASITSAVIAGGVGLAALFFALRAWKESTQ